jgi:ATP-dependent Lhr-like helicase
LPSYSIKIANILNKQKRTTEEKREYIRIHKNASLVLNYGKIAILTLVGRGIGPDTASRILRKYDRKEVLESEEVELKFLRDILKAELNYAKTRGFWDK